MYKILLADDDADDAEIFYEALCQVDPTSSFYRVETGVDILDYLYDKKNDTPHVIFLDLNMPGMNGKECLAEIKTRPGLKNVPVIMYSTSFQAEDIQETKALGAFEFITKPASVKGLTKILSDFFEKH